MSVLFSHFAGCLEDVWIWRLSKGCLGDSKECLENVWSIEIVCLSGQCLAVSGECLGVSGGCLWNVKSNPR